MCMGSKHQQSSVSASVVAPTIGAGEVDVRRRDAETAMRERRSRMGVIATMFTGDKGVTPMSDLFSKKLLGVGA